MNARSTAAVEEPGVTKAQAERSMKSEKLPKERKSKMDRKLDRASRASATEKIEADTAEAIHAAMKEVFAELRDDPKGKPGRRVKLKLADQYARISVEFEIVVKARRK